MALGKHMAEIAFLLLVLGGPLALSLRVLLATREGRRGLGPAHDFLALFTVWAVLQASLCVGLGLGGKLSRTHVLLGEVVFLVVGLLLLRRRAAPLPVFLKELFAPVRPLTRSELAIAGSLVCLTCALLWRVATAPITEGDSLAYHLPTMARWYQTGHLAMLDQYYLFRHYPYAWEAVCALLLFPFGEDFLVTLPNVIAWLMLGSGVYCAAVMLGAGRTQSMGAAALALSLPVLVENVDTMHIDLPLAAFLTAAVCFGLAYLRERTPAHLGLCLAAAGMTAGIKTSGLLYAAFVLAAVAASSVVFGVRHQAPAERNPTTWSERAVATTGALCGLLVGGFWYLRNWIELRNPLGPVSVQLGHWLSLPGRLDLAHFRRTSLASVFDAWSYVDWKILIGQVWQQLSFPFLALAVLALLSVAALAAGRGPISRARLLAALGLVAATAYLYVVTPYSGDNGDFGWVLDAGFLGQAMRYAFPFCVALAVTAAAGATAYRVPGAIFAAAAAVAVASRLLSLHMLILLPVVGAVWLLARVARPALAKARLLRGCAWGLAAAALVLLSFVARQERDRQRRARYGPIVDYIAREVRPDETIGYLLSHRSYYLYGKDYSRQVVYIPLKSRDRREWRDYLRAHDITLLAVGPCGLQRGAWETYDWLERGDTPFVRVFGSSFEKEMLLYRLSDEAGSNND